MDNQGLCFNGHIVKTLNYLAHPLPLGFLSKRIIMILLEGLYKHRGTVVLGYFFLRSGLTPPREPRTGSSGLSPQLSREERKGRPGQEVAVCGLRPDIRATGRTSQVA